MNFLKKILEYDREIWNYTCENGHKWKSKLSPGGGIFAPETTCPECKSTICKGDVYINGKITAMGAVHVDFKEKSLE